MRDHTAYTLSITDHIKHLLTMAEQPVDFQGSAGPVTGQSSGTMFPVVCVLKSIKLLYMTLRFQGVNS